MESIIYNTINKQQQIVELVHEIVEIKKVQQEKQLVKLVKAVEILRQLPVQTEKHIRRVELLLEQIRIQREILGQWPLTHVLLRKQLQQPIIKLAIEQLLCKQEFFLEEPTLMTLPVIRRREVVEQIICEELVQLLKVHKEFVLPAFPWTTFEQEQLPMLFLNQTIRLPTQRRWVEKLLEQVELVVPRIYQQEEVVRSIVPLMKELVYNTQVPRWWFFEQAKLYNQYNQVPLRHFQEEKLVEKEMLYNTMLPRFYGQEEEIVYKQQPRHFEQELYNTMMVEEQLLKEKLIYKQPFFGQQEEKIVKKEVVLPTGEKIVKKEFTTLPYGTTLYNQVPRRHFLGQEEKLVEKLTTLPYTTLEKEMLYNTMVPRCFGEEKIVKKEYLPTGELLIKKEIILPTGEKKIVKEIVLPTGEKKIVKEIIVPTTYTTMPVEEQLYKQVPRHFFEEEKLVEKVLPRSFSTTFVPRHVEEKLVERELMGLEQQPTFCHYPEHVFAHQPRRLF